VIWSFCLRIKKKTNLFISGHPTIPNIEGREHVITSDDAFFLEKLPKKVVIVGKDDFNDDTFFTVDI
jgi:hypothetical protein